MDSLRPIDLATLIRAVGYLGIFLIVFADSGVLLGLVLPGDSLLFTAGLLASQGHCTLWILMLVAALGAILGDAFGYAFGKRLEPWLFVQEDAWLFTQHHLDRAPLRCAPRGENHCACAVPSFCLDPGTHDRWYGRYALWYLSFL
jgi:membrane protein DedA with SNARE-associated domain